MRNMKTNGKWKVINRSYIESLIKMEEVCSGINIIYAIINVENKTTQTDMSKRFSAHTFSFTFIYI